MARLFSLLLLALFFSPENTFAQRNTLQCGVLALKIGGSKYATGQLAYFREATSSRSSFGVKLALANQQILPWEDQFDFQARFWANADAVHRFTFRKLDAKSAWMLDLGVSVMAEHQSERYPFGIIECATGMTEEEIRRYAQWAGRKKTFVHQGVATALYWVADIGPNLSLGVGTPLNLYFTTGHGAWLSASPAVQGMFRF